LRSNLPFKIEASQNRVTHGVALDFLVVYPGSVAPGFLANFAESQRALRLKILT